MASRVGLFPPIMPKHLTVITVNDGSPGRLAAVNSGGGTECGFWKDKKTAFICPCNTWACTQRGPPSRVAYLKTEFMPQSQRACGARFKDNRLTGSIIQPRAKGNGSFSRKCTLRLSDTELESMKRSREENFMRAHVYGNNYFSWRFYSPCKDGKWRQH